MNANPQTSVIQRANQLRDNLIDLQAAGREADFLTAINDVEALTASLDSILSAAAQAVHAYHEQGPTSPDTVEAVATLESTVDALDDNSEDKLLLVLFPPGTARLVEQTLRAALGLATGLVGTGHGLEVNEANVAAVTAVADRLRAGRQAV